MLRRQFYKPILFSAFLFLFATAVQAQVELSLIITDNLITNAFTFDPPKPGTPKSTFSVKGEKGIQAFFYFNATGTSELGKEGYRVRLKAFKVGEDKGEEWFNELTYLLKKDDKYGIIAMNFFKPGEYKVVLTPNADNSKILATGTFSLEKN